MALRGPVHLSNTAKPTGKGFQASVDSFEHFSKLPKGLGNRQDEKKLTTTARKLKRVFQKCPKKLDFQDDLKISAEMYGDAASAPI